MHQEKTSVLSNSLLWLGAAVSIAEILTGSLFAPLGFASGIAAILIGHAIGCTLLYFAGLIGAKKGLSAMETVRISFGAKGSYLFSVLNVLQLLGWTAVMIISSARAIGVLTNTAEGSPINLLWCAIIGGSIILWIAVGIKNLGKLNNFAVAALFVLTVVLSTVIFKGNPVAVVTNAPQSLSFGAAVELSAAMPISWLPLISDYTRHAKRPKAATLASTLAYFAGSFWMFAIGLDGAIFAGNSDISQIMLIAGFGIFGVIIVLLSTVTTTFLDAFSAGVSFSNITKKVSEKRIGIIACAAGTVIAMFVPIEQYQDFLYLIGSVFAPMIAILITDFFILKKDHYKEAVNVPNLLIWAGGFIVYRLLLAVDTPVGVTLPVMILTGLLCLAVQGVKKLCLKK
jgi:putative hydroxymethylpyrimidine transporter CytX